LTPNIGLMLLLASWRSSVGVDAALDLGDAFLVAENHCGDGDCASYNHRNDRNQQAA
jgi:hypothetical protein